MTYQELQQRYHRLYYETPSTEANKQLAYHNIDSALHLSYHEAIKGIQESHDTTHSPERKALYAEFLQIAQTVTDQS